MADTFDKSSECSNCGYRFCNRYSLAKHLQRISKCRPKSQRRFPCSWCEKGFNTPDSYRRHRQKYHLGLKEAPEPHQCSACQGVFANWFLWRAHMYHKHRLRWME